MQIRRAWTAPRTAGLETSATIFIIMGGPEARVTLGISPAGSRRFAPHARKTDIAQLLVRNCARVFPPIYGWDRWDRPLRVSAASIGSFTSIVLSTWNS